MTIEFNDATYHFDRARGISGVTTTLQAGDWVTLLGENGAGKSTFLNTLMGELIPQTGSCQWWDGEWTLTDKQRAAALGICHQTSVLDDFLSVAENMVFRGALRGMSRVVVMARVLVLAEMSQSKALIDQRYGDLSGGQQRLVDCWAAVLHQPAVVILDEPTTGLDAPHRQGLWDLLSALHQQEKMAVLIVTHELHELPVQGRVLWLRAGQVAFDGPMSQFIAQYDSSHLLVTRRTDTGASVTAPYTGPLTDHMAILRQLTAEPDVVEVLLQPATLNTSYQNALRASEEN